MGSTRMLPLTALLLVAALTAQGCWFAAGAATGVAAAEAAEEDDDEGSED